jgi:hypothetical protein
MPGLDSPQFKDYHFRVENTPHGIRTAVARQVPTPEGWNPDQPHYEAVGSLDIHTDRPFNESEQEVISGGGRQRRYYSNAHGVAEEKSGQLTWTGGNMNSDNPHVGWAGIAKDVPGHSRLLMGLAALAVHEHGSMPKADSNLSETGSRLARGAARKYGMEPGADNPEMEGRFDSMDYSVKADAESNWKSIHPGNIYESPMGREYGSHQLTAAQVAPIVKKMNETYRVRPDRPTTDEIQIHPGQQTLL